ncbi:DUF2256 domain-containing protein [Rhizobium populisoli]|uniref:DUF2256 domain-containing protein n=1 Tax=Rhizobium populisoli TaxID=2859785 RepID=UPI0035E42B23
MPKHIKKADLPTKPCAACGLPFTWRRKWAKNWDEVKSVRSDVATQSQQLNEACLHLDEPTATCCARKAVLKQAPGSAND